MALLRAAKPYPLASARQERVWASLQAVARGRRTRWPRLAFAATLVLVAGLFVSGALAQWPGWLARALRPTPAEHGARPPAERPRDHAAAPAPRPLEPAPAVVPAPAAPDVTSRQGSVRAKAKPATEEESRLLLAAMRALRIERSPGRARALLEGYLAREPQGALAEEALVMLIEAAAARGDRDAAALAARYFAQYPRGAFAEQIRRALRDAATASP